MNHLNTNIFNVSHNNIRMLWIEDLPGGIEEIDLNSNSINTDGLLNVWPDTLLRINLAFNPFFSLEQVASWPSRLVSLNLSNTNISGILQCWNLPETLQSLNISNTNITSINRFPTALKELIACRTRIRILPEICNHEIETIIVSNSSLSNWGLPFYWGKSLKHLDLNSNLISFFPENFPGTLEFINLSQNRIQHLPKNSKFTGALKMMHLNSNRILEIPNWILEMKNLKFSIQNNCLLKRPMTINCITDSYQWIGTKYLVSAKIIGHSWRIRKIKEFLRTLYRTLKIKDELLSVAMHPKRSRQLGTLSSEWNQVPVLHPHEPPTVLPPKMYPPFAELAQ